MLLLGCATAPSVKTAPPVRAIRLEASPGPVSMDYLAYDPAQHRVWVPAGNTGKVDVVDVTSGRVEAIGGFATAEIERKGTKRVVGPSSATIGDGVVYVGNRGDQSVCALGTASHQRGPCAKLESMPDALAFIASSKEVWATTPRDSSIVILDASAPGALTVKAKIALEGQPEGVATDEPRAAFYTNLEDKDRTLTIDLKTHQVLRSWPAGCGEDGPKGLAIDRGLGFLFVACTDRVSVFDTGHEGRSLGTSETGAGVDDIAYVEAHHTLYVGAAKAAQLSVFRVGSSGKLDLSFRTRTATGARNPVITSDGEAVLTDSPEGQLLVVSPQRE
jgi:DNA-binding beta-propeller fold protein YncE